MRLFDSVKRELGVVSAAALLAGCGNALSAGAGSSSPETPPTAMRSSAASWILPGAEKGPLLYVSSLFTHAVYIFSYPHIRLVGGLGAYKGFNEPAGICSDPNGDVFIPLLREARTIEYAHGGTRSIATLRDRATNPVSCAIDPTTGNLAVAAGLDVHDGVAAYLGVAIYSQAKGKPKNYEDPYIKGDLFCGYDDMGNLFVDGEGTQSHFALSELPENGTSFKEISVNVDISSSGNVQWDGKHIAVTDEGSGVIYRLKVASSSATVVGTTSLTGGGGVYGSWIQGDRVIGPNDARPETRIWAYPAGGDAIKSFSLEEGFSATVSAAPGG
jgi:hypothetical protein